VVGEDLLIPCPEKGVSSKKGVANCRRKIGGRKALYVFLQAPRMVLSELATGRGRVRCKFLPKKGHKP